MRPRQISKPLLALLLTSSLVLVAMLLSLTQPVEVLRERVLDLLLQHRRDAQPPPSVAVVDIDRASLERVGPWPWSRDRLARLLDAIAEAKPKAVGLDILLVGADERSAGALARQLAAASPDAGVARNAAALAARLPDADQALAAALATAPVALGLVLDSEGAGEAPPRVPILVRGAPRLDDLWREEAAIGPIDLLAKAAAGHGVLLLPGDLDGRIRRVPLLVQTGTGPRPGLALELVRLGAGSSSYLLSASPSQIATGALRLRLPADGMLRLRPVPQAWATARTHRASRLMEDPAARAALAGKLVLIGSSAPELGGFRPSASDLLVPSVQIQTDALAQMLAGDAPSRRTGLDLLEAAAALLLGGCAVWLAFRLSPLVAGGVALGLGAAWLALAALLVGRAGILVDPLLVPAVIAAGYALALLLAATETRQREAFIRRRFEQHLAPEVVQRIVAEPGLLKLGGEAREITVLFTDIEGFTAMTERAGPAELVAILDRYIDGAAAIIVEHGGMVDKVIGDGMHALFNAPLDLTDHPQRALACALALKAFSERLRQDEDARRIGLGRTRIGIETGQAIVGDVGGGKRLNYTAHGNAVNRAARLEAANKELGSTICIGPAAATRIEARELRPLGRIALRGVGEAVEVFEPWPEGWDQRARSDYVRAAGALAGPPAAAVPLLDALQQRFPDDGVVARLRRLATERREQPVAE